MNEINHIISTNQFDDKSKLRELFERAHEFCEMNSNGGLKPVLQGKILATLFYEPSTRTRFSFEAAMRKLGGGVISTENAMVSSSAKKGESICDTMKIISGYADAIVLRHPENGTAKTAADASSVPVINAGDGTNEHPTQALLDVYTMVEHFEKLDGLAIAVVGDLLYGRTVHSLLQLLSNYNVTVYAIAPKDLELPDDFKKRLEGNGLVVHENAELKEVLSKVDVLYLTRVQKERFKSIEEYNYVKDLFVFDQKQLTLLNQKAVIMHPLPRINELPMSIDKDKRAIYFKQAENGLYVRMALLEKLLI
ncbi:aspartate carbamoyltransferase [archaeon]|nr:aspartate carbamoyltransferase [archaeon]